MGNPTTAPTEDPNAWKSETKAEGYEYEIDKLTYELVWSDEFETLDTEKWTFETGGSGWGNNELQYYTNGKNAEVKDGKLIITAKRETMGNRDVTSTRMVTRHNGDWLYGKVEVRAKIPTGLGTWPAIWMMPTASRYGGWPNSGEIDIMEHVGYDEDNIVTTVHTQAYNHMRGTQQGAGKRYDGITDDFHVFSIEWLPDKIIFRVDDEENYTFDPSKIITQATYHQWPFDQKFYLILNVAFGGNWGGAEGVDYECLPASMEVDWVRVYQSPEITALTAKE
jgi:beta-glucanase (GH16 family)